MPKTSLKLSSFHSGLNSNSDPRDVADDNLTVLTDASVDNIGVISLCGNAIENEISTSGLDTASLDYSSSRILFRFSSDYALDGSDKRTNYLIAWDDSAGKLVWLPDILANGNSNTAWTTDDGSNYTHLNLGAATGITWGTGNAIIPEYYYVDGALRVCDSSFSGSGNKPSVWIGVVDRTLFNDSGSTINAKSVIGPVWTLQKQELEKPTNGKISYNAPTQYSDVSDGGVYWHIRNLRDSTDSLYDFNHSNATSGSYSQETIYDLDEYYGSDNNDESWQTIYKGDDGYEDSNFHGFGIGWYQEDDDANVKWDWYMNENKAFNTSSPVNFQSGKSIYLAVRLPGDESKSMWLGTHYRAESGGNFMSLKLQNCYITFGNSDFSENKKYFIDHTRFTDSTTPSGEWHILEFPFDDAYETVITGSDFPVQRIKLTMNPSWERKGDISNGVNSMYNPGDDFIHLSDLRMGDSELVGVNTIGKHKFKMSYTYDDKENESLLYDFGGSTENEVVLQNTTSSYKIGINAYVKAPSNKRVTGANLYIEDEGISYRIAECRYTKALRGAWETSFINTGEWTDSFADSGNYIAKSNLVKTDGLPLLESYEAVNGFHPDIDTTKALFKTSIVLNRKVYIGNIHQNGKIYGDRMLKTSTNNFDTFPSEGKEIDVAINDGDDIIKLEAYADRILQFKRNVMYLINATRSSEFLEDSFFGKGITSASNVTKTDMGIAWVNENGCYFYDGSKVHNITDERIERTKWKTFMTTYSDIVYSPLDKKLIIAGSHEGTANNGEDIYEYSFHSQGWSTGKGKLHASRSNFVIDYDEIPKYVESTGNKLYKWVDSPNLKSRWFRALTKDFDFGNPATRKKCFKFYVTYKSTGDSYVCVYYGTNGQSLTGNATGTEVDVNSTFAGTNTSCYSATVGLKDTSGVWKQAELKPPSSINNVYSVQLHLRQLEGSDTSTHTPVDFEINDITIVYREKPLK